MSGHENLRPFTSRHLGRVAMNCPCCGHQWFTGEEECPHCMEDEEPSHLAGLLVIAVAAVIVALIVGVLW